MIHRCHKWLVACGDVIDELKRVAARRKARQGCKWRAEASDEDSDLLRLDVGLVEARARQSDTGERLGRFSVC
jgi:hypothetical protein